MPDANGKPLRSDLDVKPPLFNNITYDVVNDAVTLGFPALVALFSALALIWEWPFEPQVTATGGALGLFFGVLLKIASKRYQNVVKAEEAAGIPVGGFDGTVVINNDDPMVDNFRLVVDKTPQELMRADKIVLQVEHQRPMG